MRADGNGCRGPGGPPRRPHPVRGRSRAPRGRRTILIADHGHPWNGVCASVTLRPRAVAAENGCVNFFSSPRQTHSHFLGSVSRPHASRRAEGHVHPTRRGTTCALGHTLTSHSRRRRLAVGALTTAVALGAGLVVAPPAQAATTDIQILATNDFHGRILDDTSNGEAGAAVLAGAVKQLRAAQPEHRLRRGRRPHRRLDVRVVHPARQADDRRTQRGGSRGLGGRQPRARPGLRRPRQPGHGAVRRGDEPVRRGEVAVHRGQPQDEGDRRRRRARHVDQGPRAASRSASSAP